MTETVRVGSAGLPSVREERLYAFYCLGSRTRKSESPNTINNYPHTLLVRPSNGDTFATHRPHTHNRPVSLEISFLFHHL